MRFKEFLLHEEKNTASQAELTDAVRFFRDNPIARDHLKKDDPVLFRGMGREDLPLQQGDSRSQTRRAAYTDNYVNLFTSTSPAWEDLAKRDRSFICTSGQDGTAGYGVSYMVFPADNAKVATCNTEDFWDAFMRNTLSNVSTWNSYLGRLSHDVPGEEGVKLSTTDGNKLREQLRKFDLEWIRNRARQGAKIDTRREAAEFFLDYMDRHQAKNLEELFDKVYDPKTAGIRGAKASQIDTLRSKAMREFWVEGPAFFILAKDYDELRKQIMDLVFR